MRFRFHINGRFICCRRVTVTVRFGLLRFRLYRSGYRLAVRFIRLCFPDRRIALTPVRLAPAVTFRPGI